MISNNFLVNEILLNLIKNREDDSEDDSDNERDNKKTESKKALSKEKEEPKRNFYIHVHNIYFYPFIKRED